MRELVEILFTLANIVTPDLQLTSRQVFANNASDPFYPSPWATPESVGWEEAYVKARELVSQLTLLEKVSPAPKRSGDVYAEINQLLR